MEKKEKIIGVVVVSALILIGIALVVPIDTQVITVSGKLHRAMFDTNGSVWFTIDYKHYNMTVVEYNNNYLLGNPDYVSKTGIQNLVRQNVTLVYQTEYYIVP